MVVAMGRQPPVVPVVPAVPAVPGLKDEDEIVWAETPPAAPSLAFDKA
ncbi:MAG: hypothetical protein GX174_13450 [Lentisphaerae bacterium]|nr:hypothetical protein [Lentisphaerota bacterium]